MLTKDVFDQDPTSFTLPNDGVARVGVPKTAQEWATLRWELQSFVCDGAYHEGLSRILTSYLAGISKPRQPAAWVSGFYGSGKSHLVRVLDALWRDLSLPGGVGARGLVHLPADIKTLLTELSTAGRREGGLWSAAGTLSTGVGSSVRLALMSLIFRATDLPEKYSQAAFVLWLQEEGYRKKVEDALAARGRTLTGELTNMYVSRPLAEAILAVVPDFAQTVQQVHALLREQYKDVSEILSDEAASMLRRVLLLQGSPVGKLPLTLIVLDETQQFLADDPDRTLELQDAVERFSAELEGRLLLVGTGQMQLNATPVLQKLRDRFTVTVALTDADVDRVVRAVVLRKDPTKVADVERVLDRASGEVGRQLAGTKIGPRAADKPDLVPDFPLLPARRRFWESVLRSVDSVGRAGQLRAQLRIVLEATKDVAAKPLGAVIAGDAIYDPIMADLQQSGALPRDTAALIEKLSQSHSDIHVRVAKLAYLIGRLEENGPLATGVRATPEAIADLLIDDLTKGTDAVRQRVATVVAELAQAGVLLDVDGQFILQTPTAAEWVAEFEREQRRLRNDPVWMADKRTEALRAAVAEQLGKLAVPQGKGKDKTSRRLSVSFADTQPSANAGDVPVWVRDGWSTTLGQVTRDAQNAGTDSPLVFAFVSRDDEDAIRDALAAAGAARSTVEGQPPPQSDEGVAAGIGITSRGAVAQQRLHGLMTGLLTNAKVFQGGGTELSAGSLSASVLQAASASVLRLYPKFDIGDEPGWANVIQRAKDGNANPLAGSGHAGEVRAHPLCAEILQYVADGQRTGRDVRTKFMAPPFGWPQDAVDGGLYALLAAGLIQARLNGNPILPRAIAQNVLGTVQFRPEGVVLTAAVRVAVKGCAARLGLPVASIPDSEIPQRIVEKLVASAAAAGGEPPLPAAPMSSELQQMRGLTGNELTKFIYDSRDDLLALETRWSELAAKKTGRMQEWQEVQALLRHAPEDPNRQEVEAKVRAILEGRSVLTDPDPVAPLAQKLSEDLRRQLVGMRESFDVRRKQGLAELAADASWQRLGVSQQDQILTKHGLDDESPSPIDTPTKLIASLDQMSPRQWTDRTAALPVRVLQARQEAARLLEPTAVSIRPSAGTIRTEEEMTQYLDALREQILAQLRAGRTVVL